MSAMLDAVAYRNGPKNLWRRTLWNRIVELRTGDGPILYLPGEGDLDRPVAISKGIKPADLIAVDREPAIVERLREKGATAICGDLLEVLAAWPDDRRIGAVVADLQCGLGEVSYELSALFVGKPALRSAVLAANFQRGRDYMGFAAPKRRLYADPWLRCVVMGPGLDAASAENPGHSKNRALRFVGDVALEAWEAGERDIRARAAASNDDPRVTSLEWQLFGLFYLPPYRSGRVVMDSVVMRFAPYRTFPGWVIPQPSERAREIRGHIAAALAIRTRRLRGELGGGAR